MASWVRRLVSSNRQRWQRDGFDLDLSYITDRIIAMAFPAEGIKSLYRNPMSEVVRFLQRYHPGRYKVYNLCNEPGSSYGYRKIKGPLLQLPMYDGQAPPMHLMLEFCQDAAAWMLRHRDNVVVVHCQAGKGRTGALICALLLYLVKHAPSQCQELIWHLVGCAPQPRLAAASVPSMTCQCQGSSTLARFSCSEPCPGQLDVVQAVLDFYASRRTMDGKGLTISSQRRYVSYFQQALSLQDHPRPPPHCLDQPQLTPNPDFPPQVSLRLLSITISGLPSNMTINPWDSSTPSVMYSSGFGSTGCTVALWVRPPGSVETQLLAVAHWPPGAGSLTQSSYQRPSQQAGVAQSTQLGPQGLPVHASSVFGAQNQASSVFGAQNQASSAGSRGLVSPAVAASLHLNHTKVMPLPSLFPVHLVPEMGPSGALQIQLRTPVPRLSTASVPSRRASMGCFRAAAVDGTGIGEGAVARRRSLGCFVPVAVAAAKEPNFGHLKQGKGPSAIEGLVVKGDLKIQVFQGMVHPQNGNIIDTDGAQFFCWLHTSMMDSHASHRHHTGNPSNYSDPKAAVDCTPPAPSQVQLLKSQRSLFSNWLAPVAPAPAGRSSMEGADAQAFVHVVGFGAGWGVGDSGNAGTARRRLVVGRAELDKLQKKLRSRGDDISIELCYSHLQQPA